MPEIRLTVGIPGQLIASTWKIWIQGNDIYVADRQLNRNGGKLKTSLHSSGVCRWAQYDARDDGRDRALLKWNEVDFPHPCAKGAFLLKKIIIPTNMLSTHVRDAREEAKICWISPAPIGKAVEIDIIRSSAASEGQVKSYSGCPNLLFQARLRDGRVCSVIANYVDIDNIDFVMPSEPRMAMQVFFDDIKFSSQPLGADRPVRITVSREAPIFWNMGGYRTPSPFSQSPSIKGGSILG